MKSRKNNITKFFSIIWAVSIIFFFVLDCSNSKESEANANKDAAAKAIQEPEPRWVMVDAGLRMRSGPGTTYDILGLIPYGEKVMLMEEEQREDSIDGVTGRWCKVEWQDKEGWVFGGFLSKDEKLFNFSVFIKGTS